MSENQTSLEQESYDLGDGMSADKAQNTYATGARLFKQLMRQKLKLIITLVAVVLSKAFSLAAPLLIARGINQLYDGITSTGTGEVFQAGFETMGVTLGGLLLFYLLSALAGYLMQYQMSSVSETLALQLRRDVSQKLTLLPLRYYDTHQKGDVISRATNDIEKISNTLQEGLLQFISAVVTLAGTLCIMMAINVQLTLIFLATIGVGAITTLLFTKKSQTIFSANQHTVGRLNGQIEEYFTGHTLIKLFNKQGDIQHTVAATNKILYENTKKAHFITYVINHVVRFLNNLGYVVIAVLGAAFVLSGQLSLGVIQAFFQYVIQASEPVTETSYVLNAMQAAIASAERVYQVLDEEEEVPDPQDAQTISVPEGGVSLEHVRFGYTDDRILMEDVSLDVKPGQKIAIVGPTGAGKTTLVNLLMRFYDIQGGQIRVDGVDIREMRRDDLRSLFGMVLQDTWLFGGSIAENIAFGRETASRKEIIKAATAAYADHFIRTLPRGYDTIFHGEADNISAGQKQLLTIARAILADPFILILDEATSSVDTRTELRIQKAMETLMKGRTSFVIAHRLSTIRDADCILVMDKGSIIEQGSHEQLLAQSGFYASLYNSQFASAQGI